VRSVFSLYSPCVGARLLAEERGLAESDVHRRTQNTAGRYRRHEDRGLRRLLFKDALDDDAAHRVSDQDQRFRDPLCKLRDVFDVVIEPEGVEPLAAVAGAVAGEIERPAIETETAEVR
jgi:hypothetical protein